MRHAFIAAISIACSLAAPAAHAASVGLPTDRFVETWTPLPTERFSPTGSERSFKSVRVHGEAQPEEKLAPLLVAAFASARDGAERRGIALSQMMAPWDQHQRTVFQQLREAEAAYAGADDARHARFVATLDRVVDGTGRSAAVDGSASADLDTAYAAALSRLPDAGHAATEAEQARWRAYRDAFGAFAEARTPGGAAAVTAELSRQRGGDLAALGR